MGIKNEDQKDILAWSVHQSASYKLQHLCYLFFMKLCINMFKENLP